MKLTKTKIEELVREIENFLKEHSLLGDVCIYFNNKRHHWEWNYKTDECTLKEDDDISPLDYFEYVNTKHILSMSFEGSFYHVLNGYTKRAFDLQDKFSEILERYGVYYELGHSWNLSCYPTNDDMEIEYTDYSADVKPEPEFIWVSREDVLPELKRIMRTWYDLSKATGDKGCCVIGAGISFEYKGQPYKMAPCSPWQGEGSWTPHVEEIKKMLEDIGATDIHWNCGMMD